MPADRLHACNAPAADMADLELRLRICAALLCAQDAHHLWAEGHDAGARCGAAAEAGGVAAGGACAAGAYLHQDRAAVQHTRGRAVQGVCCGAGEAAGAVSFTFVLLVSCQAAACLCQPYGAADYLPSLAVCVLALADVSVGNAELVLEATALHACTGITLPG